MEKKTYENKNKNISFEEIVHTYAKGNKKMPIKNIYDKENKIVITIKKVEDVYVIDNIINDIEEMK